MSGVVWVAESEVEYEGSSMIGVFSNAAKARKLIDKRDPIASKAKRAQWRKWTAEPIWVRTHSPGQDYVVTRYRIDEEFTKEKLHQGSSA